MSRFKSTIKALEAQMQKQQQAVNELQAENEQLQQKEAALLSSLVTLQCGVSALASASAGQQQQQSQDSSGRVSGHSSGPHATGSVACSTGEDGTFSPPPDSTASAAGQQPDAGVYGAPSPASSQAAAQQSQERQRVVEQLAALECMLEDTMLEVTSLAPSAYVVQQQQQQQQQPSGEGCGSSSRGGGEVPPVAARLKALRALAADPERVQGYLALTSEERSVWLADTTRKLGLLLPKYDAVPSARAELIGLIEELIARGLTYSWLDPEAIPVMVKLQLLNMETGQLEASFPHGFWTFVAQSLQLSTQQKLALQALWRRVKEAQGVLLAQHDALLEQLEELKQLQVAEQQLFAQQAHELPIMKLAQSLLHWRQQQIKPSKPVPSSSDQDKQQQQQQQQQQWQWHLSPPLSAAPEPCDPTNMLLPPPSADERKLEQHLAALRESVALGQQLLTAQMLSCFTHKQLAHLLVCSWPFCPDSIAVCDALDELGW